MATFVQFLKKPVLKPVVFVSGRSALLRHRALDHLASTFKLTLRHTSGRSASIKEVMFELSQPPVFGAREALVVEDAHLLDLLPVNVFLNAPTENLHLILVAPTIYARPNEKPKVRWLTSDDRDRILYIDCSEPTLKGLSSICTIAGLSDSESSWLIEATHSDLFEIYRVLDLASLFKVKSLKLLRFLYPQVSGSRDMYLYYLVKSEGTSDTNLAALVRKTVTQLLFLSLSSEQRQSSREDPSDLAKSVGVELYKLKDLQPLAKTKQPTDWLNLLSRVVLLEGYAHEGMPIREILAESLSR